MKFSMALGGIEAWRFIKGCSVGFNAIGRVELNLRDMVICSSLASLDVSSTSCIYPLVACINISRKFLDILSGTYTK